MILEKRKLETPDGNREIWVTYPEGEYNIDFHQSWHCLLLIVTWYQATMIQYGLTHLREPIVVACGLEIVLDAPFTYGKAALLALLYHHATVPQPYGAFCISCRHNLHLHRVFRLVFITLADSILLKPTGINYNWIT